MAQITLNEGLASLKTLKKRHEVLIALRNSNRSRNRTPCECRWVVRRRQPLKRRGPIVCCLT